MAITFLDQQVFTDTDIDPDGNIFVSADKPNSPFAPNLRVVIRYTGADPADGSVRLQGVVEGKSSAGLYYPVAYQFDPFYGWFDQTREIVIDQGSNWPDAGIDNIVYVGGKTIAQISNTQATLPDDWRLCIHASKNPGTVLNSVTISAFAEVSE